MKAVWYDKQGPAREVLQFGEQPTPTPGRGEALIRVHASGVNPSDVKARAGSRPMLDKVLGIDSFVRQAQEVQALRPEAFQHQRPVGTVAVEIRDASRPGCTSALERSSGLIAGCLA